MRFPSSGQLLRHMGTDAAKLAMDGRGWNTLVAWLVGHGLVPRTKNGRIAAITAASVAGAITEVNTEGTTVLSKIAAELFGEASSELGSRIMRIPETPSASPAGTPARPMTDTINGLAQFIAPWMGREEKEKSS